MTKVKDHPLYATWQNMRSPQPPDFVRGGMVCERWRDNFSQFVYDMDVRPPGMHLTRKKKDEPFSPENCAWTPNRTREGEWVRPNGEWVRKKRQRQYKWQKGSSPRPPSTL